MSESAFFLEHRDKEIPISFLFSDYLREIIERSPEATLGDAVQSAAASCGMTLGASEVLNVATRLKARKEKTTPEKTAEEESMGPAKPKGRFWGQNLTDWVESRTPFDVCCYAASFDMDKARHLYCQVDTDLVYAMAQSKFQHDFEMARANFEAAVFGFGGGFGDGDNADVVDLRDGGDAAMAELASFFGPASRG